MSNSLLSQEEVLHIAKLCNLNLDESELVKIVSMLGETLDYVSVLEELDTQQIPETYQVTGSKNVFRKDTLSSSAALSHKDALKNAQEAVRGHFVTNGVFGSND